MEQVQAFKASDGHLFDNISQCEEHETSLLWRAKIDDFIQSPYCDYQKNVHRSMCSKMIIGWEQYKSKEQIRD